MHTGNEALYTKAVLFVQYYFIFFLFCNKKSKIIPYICSHQILMFN